VNSNFIFENGLQYLCGNPSKISVDRFSPYKRRLFRINIDDFFCQVYSAFDHQTSGVHRPLSPVIGLGLPNQRKKERNKEAPDDPPVHPEMGRTTRARV